MGFVLIYKLSVRHFLLLQDVRMIYKMSSVPDLLLCIESVSTSVVRQRPCVLPVRLIEWWAVRPTGLPAGGLPASIVRTSPFFWSTDRKIDREIEGGREWK